MKFGNLFGVALAIAAGIIAFPEQSAGQALTNPEANKVQETQKELWAELDQELHAAKYMDLGKRFNSPSSADEARLYLDWLGSKFMSGDSSMIAFYYSRYLMAFAENAPPLQKEQLHGTALAAILYAIVVSDIDAVQCADKTAWADRPMTFASHLKQSGLPKMDGSMRRQSVFIATALENKGWEQRKTVDQTGFLCLNGMSAMTAGLAAGTAKERPTPEGQVGKTIGVTPPPDFVYQRRTDEEWLPDAQKKRERVAQTIAILANIEPVAQPIPSEPVE